MKTRARLLFVFVRISPPRDAGAGTGCLAGSGVVG